MGDEYQWPGSGVAELRDGLTTAEVVEALYAPTSLRMDNRAPASAPTFLAICAPTDRGDLIVVVCTRRSPMGHGRSSGHALPVPRNERCGGGTPHERLRRRDDRPQP